MVGIVEHKLPKDAEAGFEKRSRKAGYRPFLASSIPGPAGEAHRSSGVLLLVRQNLFSRLLAKPAEDEESRGRWVIAEVGLKTIRIAVVILYMETKVGMRAANLRMLLRIGEELERAGLLFVMAGDWNCTPEGLGTTGWCDQAQAVVVHGTLP